MAIHLLTAKDAAAALGISVPTLYDWLGQSDAGEFAIRGQPVTVSYFRGGRQGQGRIQIDAAEIERLQEAMRVHSQPKPKRSRMTKKQHFPGINVPLGRPKD